MTNHFLDQGIRNGILGGILLLGVCNAAFVLANDPPTGSLWLRALADQVDLDQEHNFATWYSSALLLLNALCSYRLALAYRSVPSVSYRLLLVAAGFLLLSIDDSVGLHEAVEAHISAGMSRFGGWPGMAHRIGPLFALSLAVAILAILAGPLLRTVHRKNYLILAGCIVSLGVVALAEFAYRASGCTSYRCFRVEVVFEEVGELLAIFLFLTFQVREAEALNEPVSV